MAENLPITRVSQVTQEALKDYLNHLTDAYSLKYSIRNYLENIDRQYYRELNWTLETNRAKLAARKGDPTKYEDIVMPIMYSQVETAVAYFTQVFLTGEPIFGVVSAPATVDVALQMEAVIAEQQEQFKWKPELIKCFRDFAKFNLGACEVSWDSVSTPTFETDTAFSSTQAKPANILFDGNCFKRLDLYNTFWDTSVAVTDIPTCADFVGYSEVLTRIRLKDYIRSLGQAVIGANINSAFESPFIPDIYYTPDINPESIAALSSLTGTANTGVTDWISAMGIKSLNEKAANHTGAYLKTTIYCRIMPSDFKLTVPEANTPQVWKLVFINNSVLIYAERQTNAHNYIPVIFAAPNDDGLKYQTKSLAENVSDIQRIASAYMNGGINAMRRAISDRGIYNPRYMDKHHIENPNPSGKTPLKNNAYNIDPKLAYYPIPFRDEQSGTAMQGASLFMNIADSITGQNKAQQGQFVKGNKTLHEYQDVMGNATARSQTAAITIESHFFSPIKLIVRSNILQFQRTTELYRADNQELIKVDPLLLRQAITKFKISDGLTPTDKLIRADTWQTAIQVLGSSPQIAAGYNIAPMFSYLMKSQGADVKPFEKSQEQIQYEQALQAWMQAVQEIIKANPEATAQNFPAQPQPPGATATKNTAPQTTLLEQTIGALGANDTSTQ